MSEGELGDLPRPHPVLIAAILGAAWGAAGYLVLWGRVPVTVSRAFVVSPLGTSLMLPVRLVLGTIRRVEEAAGRTFYLADSNWWIGVVSALVGAAIASLAVLAIVFAVRRVRSARRSP